MSVWLLKLVLPDSRAPAAGVPVTLLDGGDSPSGYWVSDAEGVVTIPRRDAATIKLRVGLRSEDPITLETERLSRDIVELDAPRTMVPASAAGPTPGTPSTRARASLDRDVPGHVMHFVRLALLPPEQPLLPAPGADVPEPGDFLEITDPQNTELRYGVLIDVEQYWHPLGHVGGELLYSAALGPGDAARVGIADGRWQDGARRPLDALASLMGTAGPGARAGDEGDQPLDPLSLGLGAPLDQGLTQAAADTMHWLGERAQRAGHTMRRRPLRVVELGDAPAPPGTAVRTVRAPADGPPVTYHFFEPLSRYRVHARAAQLRPAVLVPFRLPNLATRAVVRQFGYVLRRCLLDPTLTPEIDKVLGLAPAAPAGRESPPVSELRLIVHRAPTEHAPDLRQVWCFLHVDQTRYTVHFFPADPPPAGVSGPNTPRATHWIGAIRLADFHQRPLAYPGKLALQNGSASMLAFSAVHIEGRVGESWVRLFSARDLVLPAQAQVRLASLAQLAAAPGVDAGEGRLFAHLAAHLPHYAGAVIAAGDAGARYLALARVPDHAGRPLSDLVENQVAAVVGNYLAFPLRSAALAPPALRAALERYAERPARAAEEVVVTVPVPGVWISRQEAAGEQAPETEAMPTDRADQESPVLGKRKAWPR
jgi:hypothetical protein